MGNILGDIPFVAIMVLVASLLEVFLIMPAHLRSAFSHQMEQITPRWRKRVDAGFDHFRDRLYRPVVMAAVRWRGPPSAWWRCSCCSQSGCWRAGASPSSSSPRRRRRSSSPTPPSSPGPRASRPPAFLGSWSGPCAAADRSWAAAWSRRRSPAWGPQWRWRRGPGQGRSARLGPGAAGPLREPQVRNETFLAAWRQHLTDAGGPGEPGHLLAALRPAGARPQGPAHRRRRPGRSRPPRWTWPRGSKASPACRTWSTTCPSGASS